MKLFYILYKNFFGASKTCQKFGHDFVYPLTYGLPPNKCYCKCCHKKFNIKYDANFLKDGVTLQEVEYWDEHIEKDIENWER